MFKKIPWKTIGLVAVVTLVVIALVNRNTFGIGKAVAAPQPAA